MKRAERITTTCPTCGAPLVYVSAGLTPMPAARVYRGSVSGDSWGCRHGHMTREFRLPGGEIARLVGLVVKLKMSLRY